MMKRISLTLFLLPLAFALMASGIDFFHGTWEEALEKAKTEDKVIFVDAYTTWCGPCKRMAATVFTNDEVGEFYNANFVSMKIDMEKAPGHQFQRKYPVSAYPTLYYIDGKGETVHKMKGAQQVQQFISLGKMVLGKVDKSVDFAKKYDEGDRDPEMIYKYVKALNKAGKPSGKIANEYLGTQQDLDTEFNLRFLLAATAEADSRIFDMMAARKDRIAQLESAETVDEAIEKACSKTVNKAIEYESKDLLEEAISKMNKYLPGKASNFGIMANMNYSKGTRDAKGYMKASSGYAKKVVKNDASKLHGLAKNTMSAFEKDGKVLTLAEKWARQAAETGGLTEYYLTYAELLLKNGKKSEALAMAKKSKELAGGDPRKESGAVQLIRRIERE